MGWGEVVVQWFTVRGWRGRVSEIEAEALTGSKGQVFWDTDMGDGIGIGEQS